MEFSSPVFLFLFLPVFLALFYALRGPARDLYLLLASLLFYAWGEGGYIVVLLVSILANRACGSLIDKARTAAARKTVFIVALAFNLGALIFFKYAAFLLRSLGIPGSPQAIHLPLGISFFTFQAISYLVDIHRRTTAGSGDLASFALYMAFFPKLTAGPIVPYREFNRQPSVPGAGKRDLANGVPRFIIGLGKKILIADSMARIANPVFALPAGQQTAALAWLGIISYALQIYFDFSGYTDMAIGIGRICGFRLPENFNYPYFAKSIKDFWTRWHISLARWLRDYLFLPIAYSTLRRIRSDRLLGVKAEDWSYYTGILFTFLLCGLWHGANWTFVIWGGFYGVLLAVEHAGLEKFMKKRAAPVRLAYTQALVLIAWVMFRSATPAGAFSYLRAMFGMGAGNGGRFYPALYLDAELAFFLVIGIVFSFPIVPAMKKWLADRGGSAPDRCGGLGPRPWNPALIVLSNLYLIAVLLIAIAFMVAGTYHPFIYSRF